MRHYATEGTQGAQHGARARGNLKAKRAVEDAEIARLEEAIAAGAPAPGSNLAQVAKGAEVRAAAAAAGSHAPLAAVRNFDQLPLSGLTLEGLRGAKYKAMTAIQRAALPHALAGRDVLGAAKTGSGKTLAFLVPVRPGAPACAPGVRRSASERPFPLVSLRPWRSSSACAGRPRMGWVQS